jgi:taurine-pyruvate aminotransferase
MDIQTYKEKDSQLVWHHLSRHSGKAPVIMVKGEGLRLWDLDGKEYLDATSGGVWCVNVGYGRKELAKVVYDQLVEMPYYVASCGNLPAVDFSKKLLDGAPGLNRIYFSNSGSEANEKAYKMLRLLSYIENKPERQTILFRDRDYHGTTYGALSSSGQAERTEGFGPLLSGFLKVPHTLCYRCHFGLSYPNCEIECAKAIEDIITAHGPEKVVGGVFEPITAGGGVIIPVKEYYEKLESIFSDYGLKLIIDEVVCGIGRTGKMFAYQHYGLSPDIVTMAKGVASAYMPISITATTEELFKSLQSGDEKLGYFRDISTFGGSAAAAAAALENLLIIEREKLVENVRLMGSYLLDGLKQTLNHPNVGDVRGQGLLAGVEFVADKKTKTPLSEEKVIKIVSTMASKGVLAGRTNRSLPGLNTIINFAPAYIVTKADIDIIVDMFKETIFEVLEQFH